MYELLEDETKRDEMRSSSRRSCPVGSLITWSVQDPSLSHATSRAIHNVLGYPGAIGADLLMQILGLGAIMLILGVLVTGSEYRWNTWTARLMAMPAGDLLVAPAP